MRTHINNDADWRKIWQFVLVMLVAMLMLCNANACRADTTEQPAAKRLVVATKHSPPFAFKRADGSWTGISIELWRKIAETIFVEYEFHEMDLNEMHDRLAAGEVDVAIAAISITPERDRRIDFSHAYYTTGLGIAVPRDQRISMWGVVRSLLTTRFFEIVGVLVLLGCTAGVLFWKLERRRNEGMFGGRAREGVSMGMWWSAIILLGHKGVVPATGPARMLAALVMVASTVAVSALTGVLASVMTVNQLGTMIEHPDDLRHMRTVTVASSTSADYLKARHIRHRTHPTIDKAMRALAEGKSDAVVYDLAMLKYRRNTDLTDSIDVLPQSFNVQQYAIALQPQSGLRKPVNQALLTITSSDQWSDVLYRYLGE